MSTVKPGDMIAVYRGSTLYHAPADMSTVQDTDLILVQRGNVPHKCTFLDWKNSQAKAPVIGGVTLADSPEAGRFTSGTFATTLTGYDAGTPAATVGVKAWVEGSLKITPVTSNVTKIDHTTKTLPDFSTGMRDFADSKIDASDPGIFAPSQPNAGYIRPGVSDGSGISFTHLPGGGVMCYHSLRLYARCTTDAPTDNEYIAFNVAPTLESSNMRPPGAGAIVGNYKPIIGAWNSATDYRWVDFPITAPVLLTNLVVVGFSSGTNPATVGNDMGLTAIEVDGIRLTDNYNLQETILTFADNTGLDLFKAYDTPVQDVSNATGPIAEVDAAKNQFHYNNYLGITGTFVVGQPLKGATVTTPVNTKLYCKLDATLNVTDLQSADPGYTTTTGSSPYTLTWPATLPSGNPPDTDLPAGTTITTEVQATNTAGTVTKTSNTVTPA